MFSLLFDVELFQAEALLFIWATCFDVSGKGNFSVCLFSLLSCHFIIRILALIFAEIKNRLLSMHSDWGTSGKNCNFWGPLFLSQFDGEW